MDSVTNSLELGRVHELRKMDKMTHFEIKSGLLRKAESGFGLLKKQTFEPKEAF